jgi:adenine-specific DNA-methyltransferase
MGNLLVLGDNFEAFSFLADVQHLAGKIQLAYSDPPYGTNQDFTFSGERFSTISRMNGGRVAYKDTLTGEEYLKFLSARLGLIRDLLSDEGSIYIHIDSKMGHYVKVLMDKVFGANHFINDITRIKCNPKNFHRRGYGNVKDMVLYYSKTKNYIWNNPRQPIEMEDITARFRSVEPDGRKYTTTALHAPGETENGATGKKWRGMAPPVGRHWRCDPKQLDLLDERGLVEWSSTGNPRKKIYAEDAMKAGAKVQDIWMYKDPQNPKYPTEKNLSMLKMIVGASSEKNGIVMDGFCGSGTTLVAAEELGRKWVGIDASETAISICKERLSDYEFIELDEVYAL